jgi:hypothetical protein
MALCEQNRVIPSLCPPHSSNQLQALNLSFFGITQRLIAQANGMEPENIQRKHIGEVVGLFVSAVVPSNIIQSFRLSGIY